MSDIEVQWVQADPLDFFEFHYQVPKSPLFDNEIFYKVHRTNKFYVLLQGGRGSAKTYNAGKAIVVKMCCMPYFRGVIIRQVRATVKHSLWSQVISYIYKWHLQKYFDIKSQEIRHYQTGALLTYGGMDKPDSFKSINNLTHAFFEEAFSIYEKEDMKQHKGIEIIDKSIRSEVFKFAKQMWFIYNPYNTNHWLYEWFFDRSENKDERYSHFRSNCEILITNYQDNKFLDKRAIQRLKADITANPEQFKVDGLGQWGQMKSVGLYFKYFNAEYSQKISGLKQKVYDATKPLHLCFDFNVSPYISLVIKQKHYHQETHQFWDCIIDEICLRDKKIQEVLEEFILRYKSHIGDVYIYGDRSGWNKKTNSISDYATIFRTLGRIDIDQDNDVLVHGQVVNNSSYVNLHQKYGCIFTAYDRTVRNNPSVLARQILFDRMHLGQLSIIKREYLRSHEPRILSNLYGGCFIRQLIDSDCHETIKDFENLKSDPKGGKDKGNINLSHCTDAIEYESIVYFDAEFDLILQELKT